MNRLLLLLTIPVLMLWQSCAGTSGLISDTKTAVKDAAVVAKAAKDAVNSIRDGMKKPDGTTDNSPLAWIAGIAAALPTAWVGIKKYLDAKKEHADTRDALAATTDAFDVAAPTATPSEMRSLISSSPKMHAGAMVAVAKSRSR